jgi:hypothetical protein
MNYYLEEQKRDEAKKLARKIGARAYMERGGGTIYVCDAVRGVDEVTKTWTEAVEILEEIKNW